ncbi:hypothetical protein PC115_g23585 [Phytophthora cactorum]|uniref:Uncharacterized protein n=1 Tax=Phytophthora cactorum TaxID=29920 RepID=A0A8T1ADY2_9STRA|nr:hypothetical protein PC115_g23585 [Phytophthora cactorum]
MSTPLHRTLGVMSGKKAASDASAETPHLQRGPGDARGVSRGIGATTETRRAPSDREQLDDLMTAVIRDDSDAAQDFNGLIIRLPPTSLQQTGRASSSHPAFEEMMRDEGLKD